MNKKSSSTLIALTTAAMLLPGLNKKAEATSLDQKTTFDFQHSNYQEGEIAADQLGGGSANRYTIDVNLFKFKTPLTSDTEVNISGVQEAMSGASPWYIQPDDNGKPLQIMSGATIHEKRQEIGIDFHSANASSDTTLSLGYSKENDYKSLSAGFSGDFKFNQNLTTFDYGINGSQDYITPSGTDIYISRPKEKTKSHFGAVIGLSQVLTKNMLIGISSSVAYLDGYLSDPYKLAFVEGLTIQDARPNSNLQISTTVMWREFFPSLKGALHLDYRQYSNDWQLKSNTVDLGWYQNIGTGWLVIPSLRHYEQTQAAFYQPYYDTARVDEYYSCDYRLSTFSADSGQLKIVKNFDHFSFNMSYEQYKSKGDNPSMISYAFYSLGAGLKF